MRLNRLDLPLLRVLEALFDERSTTRAGDRLGLSQSAVSHALGRLRAAFGDELFVRGPDGMHPTPRAEQVGARLGPALQALRRALEPPGFAPASTTRRFVLAANPYALQLVVPPLAACLTREAPGASLLVRPAMLGVGEQLAAGRIDLAVGWFAAVPAHLHQAVLLRDRLVWAMRTGHPAAARPLTLEDLARLPQVLRAEGEPTGGGVVTEHGLARQVGRQGRGALARALAPLGLRLPAPVTVPDTRTALALVACTDLVALVPRRLAAAVPGLHLAAPPYDDEALELAMVWPRAVEEDPGLAWLRTLALAATQAEGRAEDK